MAILGYQIFIVFTILIGRVVSPSLFIGICIGWTIFTFAMVFWTPLILLQLFVIWTTFAVLAPKEKA